MHRAPSGTRSQGHRGLPPGGTSRLRGTRVRRVARPCSPPGAAPHGNRVVRGVLERDSHPFRARTVDEPLGLLEVRGGPQPIRAGVDVYGQYGSYPGKFGGSCWHVGRLVLSPPRLICTTRSRSSARFTARPYVDVVEGWRLGVEDDEVTSRRKGRCGPAPRTARTSLRCSPKQLRSKARSASPAATASNCACGVTPNLQSIRSTYPDGCAAGDHSRK